MPTVGHVAVIIPVYNRYHRLKRAIQSVLAQTYQNYTLIIVDDGSTIDLGEIENWLKSKQQTSTWITLPKNSGVAAARNAGLNSKDAQDAEWISFLDSDDIWSPKKLEQQLQWHSIPEHTHIRISQVEEGWFKNGQAINKPKHLQQIGGNIFTESVNRCVIGASCVMIHYSLWQDIGGYFNPNYRACEDYELWLRITHRETVGLVPGPLVEKHAGYEDQLSFSIPALDRYRLIALAELLLNKTHTLTEEQQQIVAKGIAKRIDILAKGAQKRDNTERANFLNQLSPPLDQEAIDQLWEHLVQP